MTRRGVKRRQTRLILVVLVLFINLTATGQSRKVTLFVNLSSTSTAVVTPATLKYNKDFAFSFTFDDAHFDAFDLGYKLFNGGLPSSSGEIYSGLFYTDGCGNKLPFTASISWFSAGGNGVDIHSHNPEYLTWSQALQLYESGWSFFNHSYNHAAGSPGIDYYWELVQNNNTFHSKMGTFLNYIVPPSGDEKYIIPAFELGALAIFSSNGSNIQKTGKPVQIDQAIISNRPVFWRNFVSSDNNTATQLNDSAMSMFEDAGINNHLWWNEFTHEVKNTYQTGGIVFNEFKKYMEFLESNFGYGGKDNFIFASSVEIFEYLKVRDNIKIDIVQTGNLLKIEMDFTDCPANLRYYDISLLLDGANITGIQGIDTGSVKYSNSNSKGLININMPESYYTGTSKIEIPSIFNWSVYPNPATEIINITSEKALPGDLVFYLYDMIGQQIPISITQTGQSTIRLDIDQSHSKSGHYILLAISDGKLIMSEKIILE